MGELDNIGKESADREIGERMQIVCCHENLLPRAQALGCRLGMPVTAEAGPSEGLTLWLQLDPEGLSLTDGKMSVKGDFTEMLPRLKQGRLQGEMLVKAARLKGLDRVPLAVDATAGMGQDSLLLAAAGFRVKLFESDPVIGALLEDTMARARQNPDLAETAGRMELFCSDSIKGLADMDEKPDVVYLDPMFPERTKSGLVKKKFQLIHQLQKPCSMEEELLQAAIAARPGKIVVKRPLKGAFLAGITPQYSLKGKSVRYDCLVFPENR